MDERKQEKHCFIIGLTGNIGTGKSTILNMLRHLSAYGIDADELTKRAYQLGSTSSQIRARFGDLIVDGQGEIDRKALAQIVFSDQKALADLEAIIHPQVTRVVQALIQTANLPVIVIEAIKLLESDLAGLCDCIWVADADSATITGRLQKQRGMSESQIAERLANQSPPADKIRKADIVINNSGSRAETWRQVSRAWLKMTAESAKFYQYNQEILALTAPFSSHILTPFSSAHMHAVSASGPMQNAVLNPGGTPFDLDSAEALICDYFVCADGDLMGASGFSVWDLSTFSFSMCGKITLPWGVEEHDPSIQTNQTEALARLHRVETIHIAILLPFNSADKDYLDRSGFSSVSGDDPAAAEWLKAGYNVFNKQFWDVYAYLEEISK